MADTALYLHIPFCRRRCVYCGFSVIPGMLEQAPRYVDALLAELAFRLRDHDRAPLSSLYLGGGTPSLLPVDELERLLVGIADELPLAGDCEITLETDPGTVDRETLSQIRALGVNRLSLGVQSLSDEGLRFLSRTHSRAEARALVRDAAQVGFRSLSADLIYGLPDQPTAALTGAARELVEAGVGHLSCYHLTIESGTALERRVRDGLALPDEDRAADLLEALQGELEALGLMPYEISNFSRPGQESRHNQRYWAQRDYLGIGLSACGFERGAGPGRGARRWRNHTGWGRYLDRAGTAPERESEALSLEDWAIESIFLGLRTREGVDLTRFQREIGRPLQQLAGGALALQLERGQVAIERGRLRLTPDAWLLADGVARSLIQGLDAIDDEATGRDTDRAP